MDQVDKGRRSVESVTGFKDPAEAGKFEPVIAAELEVCERYGTIVGPIVYYTVGAKDNPAKDLLELYYRLDRSLMELGATPQEPACLLIDARELDIDWSRALPALPVATQKIRGALTDRRIKDICIIGDSSAVKLVASLVNMIGGQKQYGETRRHMEQFRTIEEAEAALGARLS